MDPYQAQILEHYKAPLNYGLLSDATYTRKEYNPTCGDSFTFSLHVDANGIVDAVGFVGEGCAISTAAASLLSEELKGKPLKTVLELQPDSVLNLLGIELGPTRLKCALLPLQAITRITLSEPS